jgi:hypothetical protein
MFPLVRKSRSALAAAMAGRGAVFGSVALVAACGFGNGDPDPQADSKVVVCSDVSVHAWVTMNTGTEAQPDNKRVDYEVDATGHGRDPFGNTAARGCSGAGGAFGSQVKFTAPELNDGKPYLVTAPPDLKHVLVVRFTKNADGTITGTQELVGAHG